MYIMQSFQTFGADPVLNVYYKFDEPRKFPVEVEWLVHCSVILKAALQTVGCPWTASRSSLIFFVKDVAWWAISGAPGSESKSLSQTISQSHLINMIMLHESLLEHY